MLHRCAHRPCVRAIAALLIVLSLGFGAARAPAQIASPHAIDIPAWFTESFLDFRLEAAEAERAGKRLLAYFGQDGCPYCRELMLTSFSQQRIVEKTRAGFVAIALNIWGDREVTWVDGRRMSEKTFARMLGVQFTPTLLFFDEKAAIVVRLNGYQPPHRLEAVLDYVSGRHERRQPLAEYLRAAVREPAGEGLNEQGFFMQPPFDLRRDAARGRPLAVLFETRHCQPCDEMHREAFRRPDVLQQLARFDVVRFALSDPRELVLPSGRRQRADAWARELGVLFAPTIVFFDGGAREVFRVDGYLRPFHLATSLEYVAGGGYREEPEFQRFIQRKAERLRAEGRPVELWR